MSRVDVRTAPRGTRSRARTAALAAATVVALLVPVLGTAGTASAAAGDIGVEGSPYVEVLNPTESKPESKVWFHDGTWWSVQVTANGTTNMAGDPLGSSYISKLNTTTQQWTKTVEIENRATAKADVLVDGNTLYISAHKTDRNNGVVETVDNNKTKLFKFSYSGSAYSAVSGFPKIMNNHEMEALTIDRAANGTLWAAWTMGNGTPTPTTLGVYTQSSTDGGVTWSTPAALAGAVTTPDDIASIVAFDTNKVGVMWSDQDPTPASDGFFFSVHDGDPTVGGWGAKENAIAPGTKVGDDHLNLKSYNGRVFAAVKTGNDSGSSALIILLQRSTTGVWTKRTAWTGSTNVTRPIVQINSQANTAQLFVTGPLVPGENGEQGGAIFTKTVPLDSGTFNTTVAGSSVMQRTGARINDVTGSKAPVVNASGLVVLASNKAAAKNYWHSYTPPPATPPGTEYVAINPCRVLDTRSANSVAGIFGANEERALQVIGTGAEFAKQGGQANGCGIPVGAKAVEASVTAVSPGATGFFRAWPTGVAAPTATFLNFTKNQGITNTGAISLGTAAKDLTAKNYSGATHYVVDVQGYFVDTSPNGKVYVAITPCRVVDTRSAFAVKKAMTPNEVRTYQVDGSGSNFATQGGQVNGCGIPAGAAAAELAVTAVSPAGNGFLRAWPTGSTAPNATFLNYTGGQGITNTGAISLGTPLATLSLKNFSGTSNYVIDVQGYFVDATAVPSGSVGTRYFPGTPCRVVDTRNSQVALGDYTAGEQRALQISGSGSEFALQGGQANGCGIPSGVDAVEASVTAVTPVGSGFFRAWPSGATAPNATFLNYTGGKGITNTGAISLGTGPKDLTTKNYTGTAHYVVDVQGYFQAPAS